MSAACRETRSTPEFVGREASDSEDVEELFGPLRGLQSSVDLAPLLQPGHVALVGTLLDLP